MIKGLKDAQIADGLPRVLGEQPWVRALSLAMLELHRKTMDYINGSQIYTAIDTVAEEVLDALAVNWKIDWYDTGYDRAEAAHCQDCPEHSANNGNCGSGEDAGRRDLSGNKAGGMV